MPGHRWHAGKQFLVCCKQKGIMGTEWGPWNLSGACGMGQGAERRQRESDSHTQFGAWPRSCSRESMQWAGLGRGQRSAIHFVPPTLEKCMIVPILWKHQVYPYGSCITLGLLTLGNPEWEPLNAGTSWRVNTGTSIPLRSFVPSTPSTRVQATLISFWISAHLTCPPDFSLAPFCSNPFFTIEPEWSNTKLFPYLKPSDGFLLLLDKSIGPFILLILLFML